jgi:hypothetical protein
MARPGANAVTGSIRGSVLGSRRATARILPMFLISSILVTLLPWPGDSAGGGTTQPNLPAVRGLRHASRGPLD